MEFILDPSLVLYLPLYELDGASFASQDAYGHSCTVTGALWRPDGRWLDGSDDFMSIPNHEALKPTEFTYAIWVNMWGLATGETYHAIAAKASTVGVNGWGILILPTGSIRLYSGANNIWSAAGVVDENNWHLYTVTFKAGGQQIFQDLTRLKTGTMGLTQVNSPLRIGDRGDGYGSAKAKIGEVWLFNRIFSAPEIQHNYLATKWRYK